MAKDVVFVRGLEVRMILGVNEWERDQPQAVVVDLELACDAAKAARADAVEDAVNYRTAAKTVLDLAASTRFFLVETFAERLAQALMAATGSPWVRLRVSKPGAIRFARDAGVEIERGTR